MMGNEVVFDLLRGQHNGREGSLKILWRVGVPLKYIPSVTLSRILLSNTCFRSSLTLTLVGLS